MEFLEGEDLGSRLRERGRLAIQEAVDFVLQAAVAVADAHAVGIIHRDLKPANFFCERRSDGQIAIKVLDFGISKIVSTEISSPSGPMTHSAAVFGSPPYMSPEQIRSSKEVDEQTDIWALGVILFELLTGQRPFPGESPLEIAVKVATERPLPPRSLRPDVPAGLEAVILTCLAPVRRERYANVSEFAAALRPFASNRSGFLAERIAGILRSAARSSGQVPPPAPSADVTMQAPETGAPLGRTWPAPTRRKTAPMAAVLLFGMGTVAGGLLFLGRAASRLDGPSAAPAREPSKDAGPGLTFAAIAPAVTPPVEGRADSAWPPGGEPVAATAVEARGEPGANPKADVRAAATGGRPFRRLAPDAAAAATAAPALLPPAASTVNCNPPYYVDENGNRVFKGECVN